MMRRLARWHIWLGWLIAVPLLLWTATGLWMVARPIDEVRGTALRADPPLTPTIATLRLPTSASMRAERMELHMRVDGPMWLLHGPGGAVVAVDARRDVPLEPVDAPLARRIANAALRTPGTIASVRRFAADANPIDLRRDRPAWRVEYSDGVRVYVDTDTGAVLAVRSPQWRLFDLAWGLHIMDLETREDTSHPILIAFAALALLGMIFGTILLFRRRKAPLKPRRD